MVHHTSPVFTSWQSSVCNGCCVAGYDVSTKKTYNDTIRSFDKTVGLKYLKGMHINDSKCA